MSVLWTLAAVLLLLIAWEMSNGMFNGQKAPSGLAPELVQRAPYLAIFGVAFGIVGFGLWNMQNWARITTMICCFIDLAISAFSLFMAVPAMGSAGAAFWTLILRAGIDGIICLYLMQGAITKAFQEAW